MTLLGIVAIIDSSGSLDAILDQSLRKLDNKFAGFFRGFYLLPATVSLSARDLKAGVKNI